MSDHLVPGVSFAGHVIGNVLGQGGFGITYHATEIASGNHVAIKEFFPSEFAQRLPNKSVVARRGHERIFRMGLDAFLEEANILRNLPRQTGLVQVRSAFEKHGTAYCVMEFIQGDPLEQMVPRVVRSNGHVPEQLVRDLGIAVTSALSAVHRAGLVHRDIKPANIMIRTDHQPILIDFGAARSLHQTTSATSMFTRKYASVEQFPPDTTRLRPTQREGPWSDIFSLSVVLYEMVTRTLPPTAEDRLKSVRASGRDPYQPAAELLSRGNRLIPYSKDLIDLIDLGCALMPQNRPASAAGFQALLRHGQVRHPSELSRDPTFGSPVPLSDDRLVRPFRSPVLSSGRTRPPSNTGPSDGLRTGQPGTGPATIRVPRTRRDGRNKLVQMMVIILLIALAAAAYGYFTQPNFSLGMAASPRRIAS